MTQVDIARWHALLETVEEKRGRAAGTDGGALRAAPARDAVAGQADAEQGSLPGPLCELPESAKLKDYLRYVVSTVRARWRASKRSAGRACAIGVDDHFAPQKRTSILGLISSFSAR